MLIDAVFPSLFLICQAGPASYVSGSSSECEVEFLQTKVAVHEAHGEKSDIGNYASGLGAASVTSASEDKANTAPLASSGTGTANSSSDSYEDYADYLDYTVARFFDLRGLGNGALLFISGLSLALTFGFLQLNAFCEERGNKTEDVIVICNAIGFLGIFMFSGVILDSYGLALSIQKTAAFSGMFVGVFMFASLFGSIAMWALLRSYPNMWRTHGKTVLVVTLALYICGEAMYCIDALLIDGGHTQHAMIPVTLIASRATSGTGYGLLAMFVDIFFIHLTDGDARPKQMARVQFARMMGVGLGPLASAGMWAVVDKNRAAMPSLTMGMGLAMLLHMYLSFPSLEDYRSFATTVIRNTSLDSTISVHAAGAGTPSSPQPILNPRARKKRQCVISVCLIMGLLRGYIIAGLEAAMAMILEVDYGWSMKSIGSCIGCIFLCCIPLRILYDTVGNALTPTTWIRLMSWSSVAGALIACLALRIAAANVVILAAVVIFPTVFLADGLSRGVMYQHLLPDGEVFADASYAGIYTQLMTNGLGRFFGPWFARLFLDIGGTSLYLKIQVVLVFSFTALAELFLISTPGAEK